MTPEQLIEAIRHSVARAVQSGQVQMPTPETVALERPRHREHGDWTTTVALHNAAAALDPRILAGIIASHLQQAPGIAAAQVAGPGFINITLDPSAAGELARTILHQGSDYGRGQALAGIAVNLEFVSANPTGPIHLGWARWAAVGDSVARLLQFAGAQVTREYYFNDHGAQVDRFAASLLASAQGQPVPEDGYGGQYIHDIAAEVLAAVPDALARADAHEVFRREGVQAMFAEIKQSLQEFRVTFDVYFHEDEVHTSGAVDRAIQQLTAQGALKQADGALWLRTTDYGDDKDRVVIKSDGQPTYFAGDLAYYLHKREHGFDLSIIMLDADHHGYVGRMMAMCQAFGDTPHENLEMAIGQMVNLTSGGKPVRMSKRAGTVATLFDLVEAVGVDAARYALVRSSVDTSLDIDVDVLVAHSNDNPVYYVQYAHARVCSIIANAGQLGVARHDQAGSELFDPALLTHESEAVLLAALGDFPSQVAMAAQRREPSRIAHYLEELAGHFHTWYGHCRVSPLGGEPVSLTHHTRLWLAEATGQVLATGLGLLGVSAPERL